MGEATELWHLVRDYAVQETVKPLKGIGRYIAFGLAGAVCLGIGSLLVGIALLRFLESETGGALDNHRSFLPYLFVIIPCVAVIGLAVTRMGKDDEGVAPSGREDGARD